MPVLSRRLLLTGAGAAGVGLAVDPVASAATVGTGPARVAASSASAARPHVLVPPGLVAVTPADSRYQDLQLRGYNRRTLSNPDNVYIVGTTDHVVRAVNAAVAAGQQIAIRSGGHCLDGLVDNAQVNAIIDFTEMRAVNFDPLMNAFAVEPGATLGEVYRRLDYGWGVTLPGGLCPTVGIGGHVIGSGFGALSRQYGLISDHLFAIEVVVVGDDGRARAVVATREASDPNRDLWWAHTGAGGGSFGVATRFWFRSPGAAGIDPTQLLPKTPSAVMNAEVIWKWSDLTQDTFIRLARNFGGYMEQNSAPGSAARALHANFAAPRVESGVVVATGQLDPTVPGNTQLLDAYITAVGQGVAGPAPTVIKSGALPWLNTTINLPDSAVALGYSGPPRWKSNVSVLKKRYTDAQVAKAYIHQTKSGYNNPASTFALTSYGGRINAVSPTATAAPHRDAIILAAVSTVWDDPTTDTAHLTWAREFFQDLYSDTGGVPVLNDATDGLPVNWPNLDLVSAPWNTSTTSVDTLYHGANYARLQQIKAVWDPNDVFRHPLSVQLPS